MTCDSGNPDEHFKLVSSPFSSRFFKRTDAGWSEIKNKRYKSKEMATVIKINNGAVLLKI